MTPVVRRAAVFWLLLLVPTLATGGGALWLLSREQSRWEEQSKAAAESRRSSLEARARLIVENVELILGDVQVALMQTLQSAPDESGSAVTFLEEWMRSNPLLREAFRIGSDRRVTYVVDAPPGATRDWMETLLASPPWAGVRNRKEEEQESLSSREVRKSVGSNVANAQSARSAVQDLASQRAESGTVMQKSSAFVLGQSGWIPVRDRLQQVHLLGWRKVADGAVLGIEVNLEELSRRWVDLLPDPSKEGERFELRRNPGMAALTRSVASASGYEMSLGKRGGSQPLATIPVSERLLPGWAVMGFLDDEDAVMTSGRGLFLAGALLVTLLIVSTLLGGTLLVRQARRSEEDALQKTSFVANVSHEFKTPLTTIRLYAELLAQDRVRSPEQKTHYLQVIGEESERMTRLVNNALDFSRLEQGKKKYALEALDLVPELHRMLDLLSPRVAEAGMELHRDLPTASVTRKVDRDALQQIISNLIENACRYAAEGKSVTVGLKVREDGVCLVAEDRGPGISAEHRRRIFDKFHRVDDTLTAEKSGVGLGLSIARQLARGLGGDLHYEAREGGGARFVLTLA
ncbi:MAG TPA: HAMP domain-containing sensor histidine kinase [Opitutaceae bacterium]|nr:HAMP domain-containing sensor histidine kinase [Opitutaceae bacterium]